MTNSQPVFVRAPQDRREEQRRIRRSRRARRCRVLVAALSLCAVVALGIAAPWQSAQPSARAPQGNVPLAHGQPPAKLRLRLGPTTVASATVARVRQMTPSRLARWLAKVPATHRTRRGLATITFRTDRAGLKRAVHGALATGGGAIRVPQRPVAATIRLPIIKQALRNNCEAAALSTLLVARRIHVDQLTLQRQVARSGPLDPQPRTGAVPLWGDPERGFVGRPDGGGTAGGYGVYQRPIRALARRHGAALTDLTGRSPSAVYQRLLGGRPVMAWVGLSTGPYKTWRTPGGRTVTGNFGEHTVVITGIEGDQLAVNDPLTGQRLTWTKAQFEQMWTRLGQRALSA